MGCNYYFDLLRNCVLLQRWVCVYTRLPVCGVVEWIWWRSTAQCPEKIGFQYGGQLGKHMYPLARALWYLELFVIWELKIIFHNHSVHGAHKVG